MSDDTFKFRTGRDGEVRQMIAGIAQKMQRNESDAVRTVIREVARGLGITPQSQDGKLAETRNSPSGEMSGNRAA